MCYRRITLLALVIAFLGITGCSGCSWRNERLKAESSDGVQEQIEASDQDRTPSSPDSPEAEIYSQHALIADLRQLAKIIEDSHPDPYILGGGKIAFHLRLNDLLEDIPLAGMTRDEFIKHIRPFLAAIGDSHTEIWDDYSINPDYPGGIPLIFGISETALYVAGVLRAEDQFLLGAKLISVEGVPVTELIHRQRKLVPLENDYHVLEEMASRSLRYQPYLLDLLPEWDNIDQIQVELLLPSEDIDLISFSVPIRADFIYKPKTKYDLLPESASGFGYEIMNLERTDASIAYLRVDHMQSFLEASEAIGESGYRIQSATETFRKLVSDMKSAETDALIIDLRANGGGSSLMSDILIYFLYGKEVLERIQLDTLKAGGQVYRYSEQCFQPPNQIGMNLAQINAGRNIPIELGGYDFSYFFSGSPAEFDQYQEGLAELPSLAWYRATPTFYAEYESEEYAGYFLPEQVIVLVSPWTFSSGFTMTRDLSLAGAILVGTPSAQSSNSFGNGLMWQLDNTRLTGQVSRSYNQLSPVDSGLSKVLPVNHLLTYQKLAFYEFDPNAEFLYALEILSKMGYDEFREE